MRTLSATAGFLVLLLARSAGAEPSAITEERSRGDMQRAWGWVATVFGSSLLFAGAYSYARADSLEEACEDRSPHSTACEVTDFRRLFWLTAPLGAALTATGIVLLTTAPEDRPGSWRVVATGGSRDVELTLGTSF